MREIDPLISSYSHLKEKAREAEALRTLQKIASLVKPIMRQRGWRVGILREFYPPERNLLGIEYLAEVWWIMLTTRHQVSIGIEDKRYVFDYDILAMRGSFSRWIKSWILCCMSVLYPYV